ncbi:MAG: glutathione S-transferase family protein [Gammaproteobacteria bacterium]|nr:MAG: glutathione S-transferase family protein [Gammaproteobacteria bacterium]
MLKLYGISTSRAFRPIWLLEEIGLEYEHIPVDFRGDDLEKPEYLKLNPNGRVPTLVDDDLVLFESMAINLYLAKKYGGKLYPSTEVDEGRALQWSFWVMTEIEYSLLTVLMNKRVLPEDKRDPECVNRNEKRLQKPLHVLNGALAGKDYLLDGEFTVVDLNVSAVLSWCRPARFKLDTWPEVKRWLDNCLSRPSFKSALRK